MTAISAHDLLTTRTCAERGCAKDAEHESGLCDYHERIEAAKFGERPTTPRDRIRAIPDRPAQDAEPQTNGGPKVQKTRTCEEVAGCTRPTISDRGRYARVCAEHKDLVTARYAGRGKAREAVPPPAAKPEPSASPPPVEDPERDAAPSLASLAEHVETLSTRRRAMLADLDAIEAELREAVEACSDALRACAVEEAA